MFLQEEGYTMPPKFKFTREEIVQAALEFTRTAGIDALTARCWPSSGSRNSSFWMSPPWGWMCWPTVRFGTASGL